jgi:hypothetical protein
VIFGIELISTLPVIGFDFSLSYKGGPLRLRKETIAKREVMMLLMILKLVVYLRLEILVASCPERRQT